MEKITYGVHATPLGEVVIAQSTKGLCWLGFMCGREEGAYKGDGFSRMQHFFPNSDLIRDDDHTRPMMESIMQAWDHDTVKEIALDLRGTSFQRSVWKALLNIPKGQVISYGDIANDLGRPKASRAVGSAVGNNPVSLIVPCHRVLPKSGKVGNYGWGPELKKKLLEREGFLKV
jgi:AraC family transcriptional regulator of adaptative response/methylated-DNA-[protein]-cysteine methyltransferase